MIEHEGTFTCGSMLSVIDCKFSFIQMLIPIIMGRAYIGSQRVLQDPAHSLGLTVSLWVKSSGKKLLRPKHLVERNRSLIGELLSPV